MKPDKARGVESLILQMAQRGQITEKVRPACLRPAALSMLQPRLRIVSLS